MAKAAAKGKGKKKPAEPDESTGQIIKLYKKRLEAAGGLPIYKPFVDLVTKAVDDKEGSGNVE